MFLAFQSISQFRFWGLFLKYDSQKLNCNLTIFDQNGEYCRVHYIFWSLGCGDEVTKVSCSMSIFYGQLKNVLW